MTLKKRLFWFINKTLFKEEFIEESNSTVESWYKNGYEVGYSDGQYHDEYCDCIDRYFDVISYDMLHEYDDDYDEDEELALDTFRELDEYMGYALSNDD